MTAHTCVLCGARGDDLVHTESGAWWCPQAGPCLTRAAGLDRAPRLHQPRALTRDPHQVSGQLDLILDGSPA